MTLYVWNGEQVIESAKYEESFDDLFCLDTNAETNKYRYGKWTSKVLEDFWIHVPFDDFPVEFRMALLILGIT